MPPSLFAKAKLRLLDRALKAVRPPNRIDAAAEISPLARVTASRIYGPAVVADHARLHRVELTGEVSVGNSSSLWGPAIYVWARGNPVEIGNFCSLARDVSVHGFGHDPSRISTHYIGRNVLGHPIGEETISAGPVRIGHDVSIGAGSVVTRDVPPYAIAVGVPAKPVRFRFDEETIAALLASEWWTWSHEEICAKQELFTQPLTPALIDEHL